jgi:hypothetical protein
MQKKQFMKKLLPFFVLMHFIQSCTPVATLSISSKDRLSTLKRESDIKVSGPQVVTKPMLADLDVDMERKKTTFSTTIAFGVGKEEARKEAEQKAEFRFLEEHQCDFVMDPYFDTDISYSDGDGFYRIAVAMTGLSVTYKKFTALDSLPKIFTQINNLPTRTLPIIASFTSNQKSVTEKEINWGFIAGAGIGWFSGDENLNNASVGVTSYSYNYKPSAYLGFYRMYPINNAVSLRSELGFFSRNYSLERTVTGAGPQKTLRFDYSSLGLDFPVLLDLKVSDQVNLHFGPSLNLLFDESISVSPNEFSGILTEESDLQTRLALNAGLNVNLNKYFVGTRFFNQFFGGNDRRMSGVGLHIGFRL